MAAPLRTLLAPLRYNISRNGNAVRYASKKSGGSSKNTQEKTTPSRRGPKRHPGDYVEGGMILYRQLGLKYYPGENVGCGRDLTLYALERGRVVISREKLSPYPKSPLHSAVNNGMVVHKLFYNIVTDPQPNIFKLVSQT